MRKFGVVALLFLVAGSLSLMGFRQQSGQVERKQLKTILEQLGYQVTDLETAEGKEKYSVTVSQDDLNIPIGVEMSSNGNYIWLTCNLGAAPTEASPKCFALLKQNGKVQPCQFYITESGKLMMGLPVENKEVSNAVIRQKIESIAKQVGSSKSVWQG